MSGLRRHVVLPQGLGASPPKHGTHPDVLHQFEGLVIVLVLIHLVAFGFWFWLLWSSRKAKQAEAAPTAAMLAAAGVGNTPGGGRSTRDILRAYHKSTIGKG